MPMQLDALRDHSTLLVNVELSSRQEGLGKLFADGGTFAVAQRPCLAGFGVDSIWVVHLANKTCSCAFEGA